MIHPEAALHTHVVEILLGIGLLFWGRRLFWLFVGAAGFVAGMYAASLFLQGRPEWTALVVAVVAGVLGALFAVFLQRLAIAAAGFVMGGYVLPVILHELGWRPQYHHWILFLACGIVGLLLVSLLFDWALIFLSAVSGAVLILEPFHADMPLRRLMTAVLIAAGIVFQAGLARKEPRRGR
jgi:hypothetical protein